MKCLHMVGSDHLVLQKRHTVSQSRDLDSVSIHYINIIYFAVVQVLGGINKTYYHEQRGIHYTSIVKEEFYNVLITNLTVGDNVIDLNCREVKQFLYNCVMYTLI